MATDPLHVPVRDVLARLGDRAVPAPPWERIVEVDVRSGGQAADARSSRWLAVAAALVLLVGAVGVWRLQQDDDRASYATPPGVDRTIAVPLFVPAGMAYDGADVGGVNVPGYDGVAVDGTVVASWSRGDAALTVVSAPNSAGLAALPGEEEQLLPIQTVTIVAEADPIVVRWYSPTGSTGTFGVRAVGLTLEEVLAVARSAWYVTPTMWEQLADRAGFTSADEARSGYDTWAPSEPGWSPGDRVVDVMGGLQQGLTLQFLGGSSGWVFTAPTTVDRCSAVYDGENGVRQPVALAGDADVERFAATDADGSFQVLQAFEHPGLPQYRFGVTHITPTNGRVPVSCEVAS